MASEPPPVSRLRLAMAITAEEREAIYRLRYRVFIEEMGWKAADADHVRKRKSDDVDQVARLYYLADGEEIVAAARYVRAIDAAASKYPGLYELESFPEVPREAISFTSALLIAPEWRGSRALGQLLDALYEGGRADGTWLDFIHCAPSLVGLYEAMGYRRFRRELLETDVGLRIPLVLVVDDVEYLARIRSPLARAAARFAHDPGHSRWFAGRFREYAEPSCSRLMGADEFWEYLAARIHVEDHQLLRGLDAEHVRRVLQAGTILRIPRGQRIVRAGDAGADLFMLLSGAAEVSIKTPAGTNHVLETLGAGQLFGEMAFLSGRTRTADVVALSDVEVLSLNRDVLERLMRSLPEAASRVLLNLSIYLVDRLQHTTRTLADTVR